MKKLNEISVKSNELSKINFKENFDENINLKFTAKKIAFKIFYELKNRKLAQQDLAKLLDVTPQNVSKLLKGDDYKLSTLIKIENVLSINLIDREIYNRLSNNISIIIHLKSFEHKSKPFIIDKNTYFLDENFKQSNNVLEANVLINCKILNFEESINEYF